MEEAGLLPLSTRWERCECHAEPNMQLLFSLRPPFPGKPLAHCLFVMGKLTLLFLKWAFKMLFPGGGGHVSLLLLTVSSTNNIYEALLRL